MEGQVIQLEDGSAAYVQHLPMTRSGTSYEPKQSKKNVSTVYNKKYLVPVPSCSE